MEAAKYLSLSKKILQNKLAMRGLSNASIFRLDLAVTWKCNSRCNYCKVWEVYAKNPQAVKKELLKEDYEKLFDQLNINWLHVTGGEPFLKKDLSEILGYASEKMNLLIIDTVTNGFLGQKIVKEVRNIMEAVDCKFTVGVSLDGPSDVHIKSRGIKNGWNKSVSTFLNIRELKEEFPNLDAHINHFISPTNIQHFDRFISELKEKSVDIGEVSLDVARYSPFFMNEKVPGIAINHEINRQKMLLKILKNLDRMYASSKKKTLRIMLRKKFTQEAINFWISNKKSIPCYSGYSEILIDPYGFVYPCSQLKIPVGNIRQDDIKAIMSSQKMKEWREKFHNCQLCWSGCEGVTSIIQNLPFSLI